MVGNDAVAPPVSSFMLALNSIFPGPSSVMLPGWISIAAPAAVSRMCLGRREAMVSAKSFRPRDPALSRDSLGFVRRPFA